MSTTLHDPITLSHTSLNHTYLQYQPHSSVFSGFLNILRKQLAFLSRYIKRFLDTHAHLLSRMKFAAAIAPFVALCATLLPAATATVASLVEDTCEYNTYMCCWTENDGNGMEDNTDVCRVLDSPSVGATREFPGDSEGEVHCHGFVWTDGASLESFIKPLYRYVRNFDHRDERGYFGNVQGARMCECLEKMPVVSRADCTTYSSQGLVACEDNDLRSHYDNEMRRPGGKLSVNLVETCDNEDELRL